MSNYETVGTILAIIAAVVAFISAIVAARSAHAAEEQSNAAKEQVRHAADQAAAARGQVEIMRRTMAVDHIGLAMRYRRRAGDIQLEIAEVRSGLRAGIHDPNRARHFKEVEAIIRELEDMPPVFSSKTRKATYAFLIELGRAKPSLFLGAEEPQSVAALRSLHEGMVAAMQSDIDAAIERIDAEVEN